MEYALCGIPISLDCHTASVERSLSRVFKTLFSLSPRCSPAYVQGIEIQIGNSAPKSVSGEIVYQAPGLCAIKTAYGYHLRARGSFLSLDLKEGRGEGSLSPAFLAAPLEEQRGLWLFALLLLFSGRGLFALHCGGVVSPEGRGVLLAGVSGSGKTTLTCALTRSGWSYLSDDAVLLKDTPLGVEALAFGRQFHCVPAMYRYFPELRAGGTGSGKRLVEVGPLYAGRSRSQARPQVVLFPEIVAEAETRAIPLGRTETLVHLLRSSAAQLHDRQSMAEQMAVLTKLAASARGFRLLHGADVHRNPARVAALAQRLTLSKGDCNELFSAA